jgi:hypothetical protein
MKKLSEVNLWLIEVNLWLIEVNLWFRKLPELLRFEIIVSA